MSSSYGLLPTAAAAAAAAAAATTAANPPPRILAASDPGSFLDRNIERLRLSPVALWIQSRWSCTLMATWTSVFLADGGCS